MSVHIRSFIFILLIFFIKIGSQAHIQEEKETTQSTSIQAIKDSIDNLERHIIAKQSYIESLVGGGWTLPVGLRRTVGENIYTVMIDRIHANTKGYYVDVSMIIRIPERKEPLYFRTTDIPIGKNGMVNTKIQLVGNETIQLSNTRSIELLTENQNTYKIRCDLSYAYLSVEGKHIINNSVSESKDNKDTPKESSPQTIPFRKQSSEWSDIVYSLEDDYLENILTDDTSHDKTPTAMPTQSIEKVRISPNPNSGHFYTWVQLADTAALDYVVMDELGEVHFESSSLKKSKLHTEEFKLKDLAEGVYFFHIIHPSERKIIRFLIE